MHARSFWHVCQIPLQIGTRITFVCSSTANSLPPPHWRLFHFQQCSKHTCQTVEWSMSKRKCQMRLEFYYHCHCHCHYHHYNLHAVSDSDRYNIHRVLTLHSTWRPQIKKKTSSLKEVCTTVNSFSQKKTLYASRKSWMAGNTIQDGFSLTPIPSGLQPRLSIFTISRTLSPTFTSSLVKTKL